MRIAIKRRTADVPDYLHSILVEFKQFRAPVFSPRGQTRCCKFSKALGLGAPVYQLAEHPGEIALEVMAGPGRQFSRNAFHLNLPARCFELQHRLCVMVSVPRLAALVTPAFRELPRSENSGPCP